MSQHQQQKEASGETVSVPNEEGTSVSVSGRDLQARQEACYEPEDDQPQLAANRSDSQRGGGKLNGSSRSTLQHAAVAPLPPRLQAPASQSQLVQPPLVLRGWPLCTRLHGSKRERRSNSGSCDGDESDMSEEEDVDDEDEGEGRPSKSSRLSTAEWRAIANTGTKIGDANAVRSENIICASAVAPLTASLCNQISERTGKPSLDESAGTAGKSSKTGTKTSRYLREMDRRDIITRIDQGEKQAALAKEYNISRSAVCNLHKKRQQVLARAHASPFAKHPKVSRVVAARAAAFPSGDAKPDFAYPSAFVASAFANNSSTSGAAGGSSESSIRRVTSRAAELLLRLVLDPATQASDFQRYTDRLMRLVLEEALALAPVHPLTVSLDNSAASYESVAATRPACAISMEQRACPMLDHFVLLEPKSPTGYARISQRSTTTEKQEGESAENDTQQQQQQQLAVNILQANLPANLAQHNVLLLEMVVESGDAVCLTIDELVRLSASAGDGTALCESQIEVATLFISSEAAESIALCHPQVRVVAANCDLPGGQTRFAPMFRTRFEREATRRC